MRLRNWKETVKPTIEEDLMDVHPRSLDEPFHWGTIEGGQTVWIKVEGKWRRGTVWYEDEVAYTPRAIETSWNVFYGRGNKKYGLFRPYDGDIKPDTPEVRELLRKAGYFP